MRHWWFPAALGATLIQLSLQAAFVPTQPASASLANVLDAYWEDYLRLHPLQATFTGDHRYDDQLTNPLDPQHRSDLKAFCRYYGNRVSEFATDNLNAEERLSQELILWECDTTLRQLEFPTHWLPINQFESLHLTIGQMAAGSGAHPFKTLTDYHNWLQRLEVFTTWCRDAVRELREGISRGYTLPRPLTVKVIPQIAGLAKRPIREHLFYQPVLNFPEEFSPTERREIALGFESLLAQRLIPAFGALETFLRTEYLPRCRESSGISAIPNGAAYYQHQIRIYTTTTMSPDEIFQLGKSEVARLSSEMETVKRSLGFQGTLKEFFSHLRSLPKLRPFTQPQQVIDNFNAIHQRMLPAVERLFSLTPKTAFEVRRTEAFREASASAEYHPGSLDGTRPGIFYVPIPDVMQYNTLSDEDLFLHEAIPGHHYQISLQQENATLPQFRRPHWYSSYGEGWALYCESLGKELGLYEDPYQYFGMLSAEMHRAIRLVVDVGIHAKGWTREDAIQYSLDHEAEPEASIISEIERYMAWPGQALSYKIGQLKIRELRNRAEQTLGDRFDIRVFHAKVLESGCLPLTILENKIDHWIKQQAE